MPAYDYRSLNQKAWNARATLHVESDFYDRAGFLARKNALHPIERDLLGEVSGKTLLHLQCHFGIDTLSLARMGAQVTGVDFSETAVAAARQLADDAGLTARFICSDVYDLSAHIQETFDLVFSSYGTIGWLPDLDRWAEVVAGCLRPGGRFVFAEFHPALWMFDDDFTHIQYRYFQSEPIVESHTGTYAVPDSDMVFDSVTWNHGLGETVTALCAHGLRIAVLKEFVYSPYPCFRCAVEAGPGKFRVSHLGDRIPYVFALSAWKPD